MNSPAAGAPDALQGLDPALQARLTAVIQEGWEIWERFDLEVRTESFHPFVAADYERVLQALIPLRAAGRRFLEWGSATGVITILADILGFEAWGIELDPALVEVARGLAERHGSGARFAAGSFLPAGYRFRDRSGDDRIGTLGYGASAYPEIGHPLDDFDVVYGYPWEGEAQLMRDLMDRYGDRHAHLLVLSGNDGVRVFRGGREVA